MRFEIITIFPEIFGSYFGESIIKRAQKSKLIDVRVHNLRNFTLDKHKTVDDTPYGGGVGMVLKVEPVYRAIKSIKKRKKTRIILFSAKGKRYTQKDVRRLSKYDNLILVCGRYEGMDERVAEKIADEEISIGDYVLTGGEIPAMVLVDSISRMIPGVLGNIKSSEGESHSKDGYLEYPQYTKPENFSPYGRPAVGRKTNWKVPKILLSGNHEKIKEWRKKHSKY